MRHNENEEKKSKWIKFFKNYSRYLLPNENARFTELNKAYLSLKSISYEQFLERLVEFTDIVKPRHQMSQLPSSQLPLEIISSLRHYLNATREERIDIITKKPLIIGILRNIIDIKEKNESTNDKCIIVHNTSK